MLLLAGELSRVAEADDANALGGLRGKIFVGKIKVSHAQIAPLSEILLKPERGRGKLVK